MGSAISEWSTYTGVIMADDEESHTIWVMEKQLPSTGSDDLLVREYR